MEYRREWGGLLDQPLDQLGGTDSRISRNVVDRLFRIERGALPARRRQRIEDVAAELEHAAFENRKQPHRPGADDRDITAVESVLHRASLAAGRARASAPAAGVSPWRKDRHKQILRPLASEIYKP